MTADLGSIGRSFAKLDGSAKVRGQAIYADDIALPRMLHCRILRAQAPHARILSVDTSAARRIPGVVAVLTGRDLPIRFGILPVSQDEAALEEHKVRYVGDPVAAVAAVDEETAAAACEAIKVEYQLLEPVMTIDEALREAADEPIQEAFSKRADNIHRMVSYEFGDLAAGFAAADLVREDVFFFQGNTHLPMEQHSAVATYVDDRLTLWSSTQVVHYVHRALSRVLELPMSRIRVIGAAHGGGFGGKTDPFAHEIVVARLAMLTGRPVKCTLTRGGAFYAPRGRHRTPCRRSPTTSRPTSSRASASTPTSRPAARSAGTARRRAGSGSSSTWRRSPTNWASTRWSSSGATSSSRSAGR